MWVFFEGRFAWPWWSEKDLQKIPLYSFVNPMVESVKNQFQEKVDMCAMVKSRYIGDGHPTFTFNRNPYNGYINPYYWVDDHPRLYGNNGSLDPGTCNNRSQTTYSGEQGAGASYHCHTHRTTSPYICNCHPSPDGPNDWHMGVSKNNGSPQ